MNIYSQKQQWKLVLMIIGLIIVASSLWYTNNIVKQIANEERKQVELWAQAIQRKANLVKYTNDLFEKLKKEERKRIETWAEATKMLVLSNSENDLTFYLKIVQDNTTIPVILTDEKLNISSWMNLDSIPNNSYSNASPQQKESVSKILKSFAEKQNPLEINYYKNYKNKVFYGDTKLFIELKTVLNDLIQSFISDIVSNAASSPVIFISQDKKRIIASSNVRDELIYAADLRDKTIQDFEKSNTPILIELGTGEKDLILYKDSALLTTLKYFPIIQFLIIGVFLFIAYSLFSTARKVEQNQVWVGMSKETAHQLGTPLSSLIGWVELLKAKGMQSETVEIEKDIARLNTIAERFSKIGSQPNLVNENVSKIITACIAYMQVRSSQNVNFIFSPDKDYFAKVNPQLFEWVIENLIRNAIDAMENKGKIKFEISQQGSKLIIDVEDSGKGVPKNNFKTIFEPGYTTKKRGWGLGLSLSKRIIEEYHNGKISVKHSEVNEGTTFRIVLNA